MEGMFGKYKSAEEIPVEERKYYFLGEKFVPTEGLEFDDVLYNQKWPVKVPRFVHEYHGWWDYWEIERNLSMEAHLRPGMVLWDVGTFDGWLAAVYQRWVGGPENIVLIEPHPDQWSNTKITWEANGLAVPRATYQGFISNTDTPKCGEKVRIGEWPQGLNYDQVIKAISFRLLHEPSHVAVNECMRIDTLAGIIGEPDAITIDIEGAEMLALEGAFKMLSTKRPLVWIAVHPEFLEWRFGVKPLKLHKFMYELDYEIVPLATDHEEHFLYLPR